jgi:hypothetical protein
MPVKKPRASGKRNCSGKIAERASYCLCSKNPGRGAASLNIGKWGTVRNFPSSTAWLNTRRNAEIDRLIDPFENPRFCWSAMNFFP